jgi:hypothetical protein
MQSPVFELIYLFNLVNDYILLLTGGLKSQDKAMVQMGKYTKIMRASRGTCKFYTYSYADDGENTWGCLFWLRR